MTLYEKVHEAVLQRLENPTANTVEEAATQISKDVIDVLSEQAVVNAAAATDARVQPRPLSVTLTGRSTHLVVEGELQPDALGHLDLVERAALTALTQHILHRLQPQAGMLHIPPGIMPATYTATETPS